MKVLSRDFSFREKVLLLILMVMLIFFAYYKLVDEQVRTQTSRAKANITSLTDELQLQQTKLKVMQSREKVLETIKNSENSSIMDSYNASSEERKFLNNLLRDALEYNITFQDAEQKGKQIRRSFSVRYTASDYETAQEMLHNLYQYPKRLLIADVQFNQSDRDNDLKNGAVVVTATATFYETIIGGEADAGLKVIE